jgi:transcriptional regulator with XRE-family HTH domain
MRPKTLAMNVKRLRTQRGLTQMELAKKTKVTQAFIAQLETGAEDNPTLATLRRLAKALKVTIAELVK